MTAGAAPPRPPLRAYPHDLAVRVREKWPEDAEPLPECLERIFDTAYHASFLRDEERAVTFRILCARPSTVRRESGPPEALLPLAFREPRGFDEHELRRLCPAAKYYRALIGVHEIDGALVTWGIVQSGPRWLQSAYGGRAAEPALPPALVVRVARPGHIVVACGNRLIAELRGGRIADATIDVFGSRWLAALFAAERDEVALEHRAGGGSIAEAEAAELTRFVAQQMVKRVISTMRTAHHGGTLVILPTTCAAPSYLSTKYPFDDDDARRHFRRVVHAILKIHERTRRGEPPAAPALDAALGELDEALFELAHLMAALADVDGAVVLTKRFEILGFGAEIAGNLPAVTEARRALDLEGETYAVERVDAVGTRHRSAYRLCAAVPGALAVVVSQDGSVRFVTHHRGAVTYWDHGAGDG